MDQIERALNDLTRTSDDLFTAVSSLADRISATETIQAALKTQQDALAKQQRTNEKQRGVNVLLATSLILDLVLSVAIGFGAYKVDGNADAIRKLQNASTTQDCAETSLWLGLIAERLNDPETTEKEKAKIEVYRLVFQNGYDTLDCASSFVPSLPTTTPSG